MGACVVGIAGGSASGKSTLAQALAGALQEGRGHRVSVVASDRYMRRERPEAPTFFSASAGEAMFDANHPDAIVWDELIRDLGALRQQADAPEIVIVEGHLILHEPALREQLDLRLFVELDADERALRRMLRDMQGGRANRDPRFIANYYRESARVGHARYIEPSRVHADLIIRGDADWQRVVPLLVGAIEARLAPARGTP
jgi:uridine kinase